MMIEFSQHHLHAAEWVGQKKKAGKNARLRGIPVYFVDITVYGYVAAGYIGLLPSLVVQREDILV